VVLPKLFQAHSRSNFKSLLKILPEEFRRDLIHQAGERFGDALSPHLIIPEPPSKRSQQ